MTDSCELVTLVCALPEYIVALGIVRRVRKIYRTFYPYFFSTKDTLTCKPTGVAPPNYHFLNQHQKI